MKLTMDQRRILHDWCLENFDSIVGLSWKNAKTVRNHWTDSFNWGNYRRCPYYFWQEWVTGFIANLVKDSCSADVTENSDFYYAQCNLEVLLPLDAPL